MLTNEDRNQILSSFLETIKCISDKEYQGRVWIRGEGPECDDFTETVCYFFEEAEGILANYSDFKITNRQHDLLVQLQNQFDRFVRGPRPYLPQDFIDTPEWNKITEMAREVLKAFNYQSNLS